MASTDLTATTIYAGSTEGARAAIDATTLLLATDHILVLPVVGRDDQVLIIKVEREA